MAGHTQNKLLWVVEDDPGLQFFYRETFADLYEVELFPSIGKLKDTLFAMTPADKKPVVVVADIGLPDGSFLDFLTSKEGARLNQVPVLVVSSIDDARILRLAFKRGATDYIVKPFSSAQIQVKVELFIGLLKRVQDSAGGAAATGTSLPGGSQAAAGAGMPNVPRPDESVGAEQNQRASHSGMPQGAPLALAADAVSHSVSHAGRSCQLTQREFQLVTALIQSMPFGLRKDSLIAAVWHNVAVSPKNLEVQLVNLRKKLTTVGHRITYVAPYYLLELVPSAAGETGDGESRGKDSEADAEVVSDPPTPRKAS